MANRYCSIHKDQPVFCCGFTECPACSSRWYTHKKNGDIPAGLEPRFYGLGTDTMIEEAKIAYNEAKARFDAATSKTEQEMAIKAMQAAVEKRDRAIELAFAKQRESIERERQQKLQEQEEGRRHREWISHHSTDEEIQSRLRKLGIVFPGDK